MNELKDKVLCAIIDGDVERLSELLGELYQLSFNSKKHVAGLTFQGPTDHAPNNEISIPD